jgi:hypothetical protein
MSLFNFIKKLHSILHSAVIKQGHFLQKFVFKVLQSFYCESNVFYERKFLGDNRTIRKYHKVDCFVLDTSKKKATCFEVRGEGTNFNIAVDSYLKQIASIIRSVQLEFPGYKVKYIIVKYNYSGDSVYQSIGVSYPVLSLKDFCIQYNVDIISYSPERFLISEVKQQFKEQL